MNYVNKNQYQNSDRIIDKHELNKLVPYSQVHIHRLEKKGEFPNRITLGPNRVGWSLIEVQDWIESKKRMRDEEIRNSDKEECK